MEEQAYLEIGRQSQLIEELANVIKVNRCQSMRYWKLLTL
jgi:hypothetical protein